MGKSIKVNKIINSQFISSPTKLVDILYTKRNNPKIFGMVSIENLSPDLNKK